MRYWTALLAMGLVIGLSGCGAGQGGAPASTSGSGGGSGSATSVDPTGDSGIPEPPSGLPGVPAPIVEGTVTVAVDPGGSAVGQKIRVTVHNGNDRPAHTQDLKTPC